MKCDLLLKNGRLYNPKRGIDKVADLAIQNGKIVYSNQKDEVWEAKKTVDVSGCFVVPGLIDIHTHLHYLGTASGMPADLASIPYGVTASLDAGSTGVSTVRALAHGLRECTVKTKFMLNVSASGIIMANQFPENVDPSVWDIGLFDEVFAEYGDQIPALKLRISKKVVGELGLQPVKSAIELSERYHVPICIHTTNPPDTMSTVAQMLRKGDILTHMYHGAGMTCIENGKVAEGYWKAKERGVVFDTACGQGNLSLVVAKEAIAQGFLPDSISTDLNIYNWNHDYVFSLTAMMSKFLALGMKLSDVVDCVTEAPAEQWGAAGELGCLLPGTAADITVLKIVDRKMKYQDKYGNVLYGNQMVIPEMTVIDGKTHYQSMELHP